MFTWTPGQTIELLEREAVLQSMRYFRGNMASAARALGITERTIRRKLGDYQAIDEVRDIRAKETKKRRELNLLYQRAEISQDEYNRRLAQPESHEEEETLIDPDDTDDLNIPTPEAVRAHG